MTPEEAYQEALRRIREAERTGALKLDLSSLALNRLPGELACLKLRLLNLSGCNKISDASPLARLTSLQSLNLIHCGQLSGDLSPLASLTSLQTLKVSPSPLATRAKRPRDMERRICTSKLGLCRSAPDEHHRLFDCERKCFSHNK
jgi:hypothetical protein